MGGQAFEGFYPPNHGGDEVARVCPPAGAYNGRPPCVYVGGGEFDQFNQSFAARSKHTRGVNAALGDGSVRFFPNSINVQTWRALSTARGGEAVSGN